jgi:putative ABC transport system substrate-binding protein
MRRRDFLKVICASGMALPSTAWSQQPSGKIPVVGVLWHAGSAEEEDVFLEVVEKAFQDLGYVQGKNIRLEHRFPAEKPERFRILAQELVEAKCDALMAATGFGAVELRNATSTIPIVFVQVPDPVGVGLVASLARPGGNVTGLSPLTIDLSGKRLALLKEAVPNVSRVALLVDVADPFRERGIKAHQAAAEALGITLWSAELTEPDAIEPLFAKIVQERPDAVVWGNGPLLFNERRRVGKAVLAHRLPAVVAIAEEVPAGLLMSYGQDLAAFFRRAPTYVNKILKGAKPADLPVEQSTRYKLVVNIKTAKSLGLTIPSTLFALADEVIE